MSEIGFVPHPRIPVACVQTRAHDRAGFADAWQNVLTLTERAAAGAKLVVLPEATVPGYVLGTEPVDDGLLARAQRDLAAIARAHGATIVYGGAKTIDGRTFNAAIALGPEGDELGFAAKQFLWHFDRRWFAAGAALEPIDTPVGRLGLLVCADGRIPSIAATLVERGAEMLVMPTAWVTSGRDPNVLENVQADLMVNVRARENGVPFAGANKCGVELESVLYCGKSAIVDAAGAFVARASERDEEIVFGEVATGPRGVAEGPPLFAMPSNARANAPASRAKARIAFTLARDAASVARFAEAAAVADADALLALGNAANAELPVLDVTSSLEAVAEIAGVRFGVVSAATLRQPRGLVSARLSGLDAFAVIADGDAAWHVPFARTRATELRAYVVVFDPEGERAFAVDPDGAVVAGTYGDFRLAAFVYDRARTEATMVAPFTDVLQGLRTAESIRSEGIPA